MDREIQRGTRSWGGRSRMGVMQGSREGEGVCKTSSPTSSPYLLTHWEASSAWPQGQREKGERRVRKADENPLGEECKSAPLSFPSQHTVPGDKMGEMRFY